MRLLYLLRTIPCLRCHRTLSGHATAYKHHYRDGNGALQTGAHILFCRFPAIAFILYWLANATLSSTACNTTPNTTKDGMVLCGFHTLTEDELCHTASGWRTYRTTGCVSPAGRCCAPTSTHPGSRAYRRWCLPVVRHAHYAHHPTIPPGVSTTVHIPALPLSMTPADAVAVRRLFWLGGGTTVLVYYAIPHLPSCYLPRAHLSHRRSLFGLCVAVQRFSCKHRSPGVSTVPAGGNDRCRCL